MNYLNLLNLILMINLVLSNVLVITVLSVVSMAQNSSEIIEIKKLDNITGSFNEEKVIYLDEYFAGNSLTYEVDSNHPITIQ